MKILVAGTGSIGRRHIENLRALKPGCRFVLLRDPPREDDFSEAIGATVVEEADQGFDLAPDCLLVCNPSALHAPLVRAAIARGVALYVEKPVVTAAADLAAVRADLRRHDYRAASFAGCNLRLLPSLERLAELVGQNRIGRVVRAQFEAGQWLPDWRPGQDHRRGYSASADLGGGVVFDLLHEIDALRWLLGEAKSVAAMTSRVAALAIDAEAVLAAIVRTEGDCLASFGLDYVARRPVRRYRLVGEAGSLVWDLGERRLLIESADETGEVDCGAGGFDVGETYRRAMAEFVHAIERGGDTGQPLAEGLRSAALAIRIREEACRPS